MFPIFTNRTPMVKHSITTLSTSPQDDRSRRMRNYTIMMVLRLLCFLLCLFVTGWLFWLCVAGAVFLPYIAVMIANNVDSRVRVIESPTLELSAPSSGVTSDDEAPDAR